ncbi:MAG: hypothetical protein QW795_03515 [Candidatus Bathyarchaeia archaeon]
MAEEKPSPVSERPIGQEESVARSLQELTTPHGDNIDFLTDLDDEDILNISALKVWSDLTGFEVFKEFCNYFERLRVSRLRLGRKEIGATIGLSSGGLIQRQKSLRDLLGSLRI